MSISRSEEHLTRAHLVILSAEIGMTFNSLFCMLQQRSHQSCIVQQLKIIIKFICKHVYHASNGSIPCLKTQGRKNELVSRISKFLFLSAYRCPIHKTHSEEQLLNEKFESCRNCQCVGLNSEIPEDQDAFIEAVRRHPNFINTSCFYRMIRPLCVWRAQFYQNSVMSFTLNKTTLSNVKSADNPERIILQRWCSIKQHFAEIDSSFDIQVNGFRVETLPSRSPWSDESSSVTEPLDISRFIQSTNSIAILSREHISGLMQVDLASAVSIQQIVADIKSKQHFPIQLELCYDIHSNDIELSDTVASLRCPLSWVRLRHPVKGINCSHFQCFDLAAWIEYSNQQKTWQCPICHTPLDVNDVRIDDLFESIINGASSEIDSVKIAPNGSFVYIDPEEEKKHEESIEERSRKKRKNSRRALKQTIKPDIIGSSFDHPLTVD